MRVGLVCPYTWEVPGGVREHVSGLAEALMDLGHEVSVIAPADDDADLAAICRAGWTGGPRSLQRVGCSGSRSDSCRPAGCGAG